MHAAHCDAQGLWQLLHCTTQLDKFLVALQCSIGAWPGASVREDIAGHKPTPDSYAALQSTVMSQLSHIHESTDMWQKQFLVLCIVWVLPDVRQQLQADSPKKVNEQFFSTFCERMNQLVFGDSVAATSGHYSRTPLEVVIIMCRELRDAYVG